MVQEVGRHTLSEIAGDRVALNWAPIQHSFYCLSDRPSLCEKLRGCDLGQVQMDGTRLFKDGKPLYQFCSLGCFADYAVVPR